VQDSERRKKILPASSTNLRYEREDIITLINTSAIFVSINPATYILQGYDHEINTIIVSL
jgi:hypothetical protein